jgi:uncharacterized protein (DUF779 family)
MSWLITLLRNSGMEDKHIEMLPIVLIMFALSAWKIVDLIIAVIPGRP